MGTGEGIGGYRGVGEMGGIEGNGGSGGGAHLVGAFWGGCECKDRILTHKGMDGGFIIEAGSY